MFIHSICKSRPSALFTHYTNKGLTSRVHKNLNTLRKHALSAEDTNTMLDFVKNYVNKHCASSSGQKPDEIDLEKRTGEYLDSKNHDDDVALDFGCCDKSVSQSDLLLNETVTYSVENHTPAEHEPLFVNRGTSIGSVLSSDSADVHFQELTNSTSTCLNSNAPDKLTPSEILVTMVPSTRAARFCNSSEDNTASDSLLPASFFLPQQPLEPKSILPDSNPLTQGIVRAELVNATYFSLCNLR
ncbi:hypothetical protein RRG08_060325 [Elysia crispata]|uniref:Uncharacterized protein n=1 Tax=Elysia crispata TaxID=231223 RepID=A0AAE1AMN2_9GAST|nr:hypothetical protein RRG08_060325 [Elysia crispata]